MPIYGSCKTCGRETCDYVCANCIHEYLERCLDALKKIAAMTTGAAECECGGCVNCIAWDAIGKEEKVNAKKQLVLVMSWKDVPIGTDVIVRKDDRSEVLTKTKSGGFLLGGHTACIMLEGISGAYLLERVRKVLPVQ